MNTINFEWDENKNEINKKKNMAYHLKLIRRCFMMKMQCCLTIQTILLEKNVFLLLE